MVLTCNMGFLSLAFSLLLALPLAQTLPSSLAGIGFLEVLKLLWGQAQHPAFRWFSEQLSPS